MLSLFFFFSLFYSCVVSLRPKMDAPFQKREAAGAPGGKREKKKKRMARRDRSIFLKK
jgi:hypothetical protein